MGNDTFDAYSAYYDLLYHDKDYEGETGYVLKLLSKHMQPVRSVLDLGCGSGRHVACMARQGLDATGIELSESMHGRALALRAALDSTIAQRIEFIRGDARSVRTGRHYDAVTALFHVASYQTTNADLRLFFQTAAEHLKPGGLFLFDCWYGPAVLTSRPEQRVRDVRDATARIIRFTRPTLRINDNVVEVLFSVLATPTECIDWKEFEEIHSMRYLFLPEVRMFLEGTGLQLVASEEFLSGKPLGEATWNACFVGRKQ